MKKIPTLFEREYADHKVVSIKPVLTDPSLQWVLDGEGEATLKIDGTCCAIINGKFYRQLAFTPNQIGLVIEDFLSGKPSDSEEETV